MTHKIEIIELQIVFKCILIALTLIIPVSNSLSQNNIQTNREQKIYFEYYNYSPWLNKHIHWIIDSKGDVRINSQTDSEILIDSNNIRNYKDIFDYKIHKVDLKELKKYTSLIPEFSEGQIVCEDIHRLDYGTTIFNCFMNEQVICLSRNNEIKSCNNEKVQDQHFWNWLKTIEKEVFEKIKERNYLRE